MKTFTLTKKQIKRTAAIALLAAAVTAAGVTVAVTSVRSHAADRRVPVYSVERDDKKIGLTFDAAWENSNTQELIDILEEGGAKATFFVTGDWCDRCPEDVKMLYEAGHEIENHSDAHPHPVGMNVNDLIDDTRECSQKIKALTGEEPRFYRAPYGEYDDTVLTTMEGMGLIPVQWDVDSVDWKKGSPDDIRKKVLSGVKSGSILLFHNDLENTTKALPGIISSLTKQGYEFVPISELVYTENYTIDANGVQKRSRDQGNSAAEKTAVVSPQKAAEVIARYSDELKAAQLSDEQINALAQGDFSALPEEARPIAEQVWAELSKDGVPIASDASHAPHASDASHASHAPENDPNASETSSETSAPGTSGGLYNVTK